MLLLLLRHGLVLLLEEKLLLSALVERILLVGRRGLAGLLPLGYLGVLVLET